MADPYLGEIKMVGWNFAARGWAFTNGQLLPINQNQALFSLLGSTYGGNGITVFALPDIRSRVPMHQGQGAMLSSRPLGTKAGSETTSLSPLAQIPGVPVAPIQALTFPTTPVATQSPFLVVSFLIALQGRFPPAATGRAERSPFR